MEAEKDEKIRSEDSKNGNTGICDISYMLCGHVGNNDENGEYIFGAAEVQSAR